MKSKFFLIALFISVLLFAPLFVSSETGGAGVTFFTGSDTYSCEKTSLEAHWKHNFNGETINIYNSTDKPLGLCNDTSYSDYPCCPTGFVCDSGKCVSTNLEYSGDFCALANNSQKCNVLPPSFAVNTFESFGGAFIGACGRGDNFVSVSSEEGIVVCSNLTACTCTWNQTKSQCMPTMSEEMICSDGTVTRLNNCSWAEEPSEKQNLCETEGKILVTFKANPAGNVLSSGIACQDQQASYPCSVSVQLPFFGKFQFIASILLIAAIYAFMRRKE
jgi:hypothetical protein